MVENGLEGKGILASLAPHAEHLNQGRCLASRRLVPGFQGKQGGISPAFHHLLDGILDAFPVRWRFRLPCR